MNAEQRLNAMTRLELIALGKSMNTSATFGKNYTKMSKDELVAYLLKTKTTQALEAALSGSFSTPHTPAPAQPAQGASQQLVTLNELVARLNFPQMQAVAKALNMAVHSNPTIGFQHDGTNADFVYQLCERANTTPRKALLLKLTTDMLKGQWPEGFGSGTGEGLEGGQAAQGEGQPPSDSQNETQAKSSGTPGEGDDDQAGQSGTNDDDGDEADGDGEGDDNEAPTTEEEKAEQEKAEQDLEDAKQQLGMMADPVVKAAMALDILERKNYPKNRAERRQEHRAEAQQAPAVTYKLSDLDNPLLPLLMALKGLPAHERKYGVILAGKAGSGKTFAAEQVGGDEDDYSLLSCSGGATETVLIGRTFVGDGMKMGWRPSSMVKRYLNGGICIADEVDALDPNAATSWNALTANNRIDIEDRTLNGESATIHRHDCFWCIATANTYGDGPDAQYVGRFQMDGASRDRWIFIRWPENENLRRHALNQPLKKVKFWKPTRTQAQLDEDFATLYAWCEAVEIAAEKNQILRVVGVRLFQKARMLRLIGCGTFGFSPSRTDLPEIKSILLAGWQADDLPLLGEAGKV